MKQKNKKRELKKGVGTEDAQNKGFKNQKQGNVH